MPELVIVGAGGFGREVLDVVEAVNSDRAMGMQQQYDVLGFVDDGEPDSDKLASYSLEHLGPVSALKDMPTSVQYVIGIGNPQVRATIDATLREDRECPVLIHPAATVAHWIHYGPGTVVCAGARLTNHITLGRHVHVNINATIGHDATLGDYVTVSPLVAISGYADVREQVMLGTSAVINPGVTVGERSILGSGAVATKDIEAGVTAVGAPAKPR